MNITNEAIEILIGRHIDGEITPSEQRMLEAALERDSAARGLFEGLRALHESSVPAVGSEMTRGANEADEVFERAWRVAGGRLRRIRGARGVIRFVAGLAAGIVIGAVLHFAVAGGTAAPERSAVGLSQDGKAETQERVLREVLPDGAPDVMRNVDWYSFTDRGGDQWLIEGLRENMVKPAAYYGDL
ncbi:MAG: hypothetical protein JSU94_05535 [Phycisphaerales bacterium]|nr:MAG: hypothetical protein JSU94_19155 [Phycisphaerales bacterium]UCG49239.1 MAG: hypothetical protein JSU94_05535 [Phycisphaerales bacterium]